MTGFMWFMLGAWCASTLWLALILIAHFRRDRDR